MNLPLALRYLIQKQVSLFTNMQYATLAHLALENPHNFDISPAVIRIPYVPSDNDRGTSLESKLSERHPEKELSVVLMLPQSVKSLFFGLWQVRPNQKVKC